jgi:hypothetical protein
VLQAAAVIGTERLLPSLESNPKYAENVSAFGLIDTGEETKAPLVLKLSWVNAL